MRPRTINFERGFTLAEAVIVIVITGIIASIVAVFIRTPVQGYMDSAARADLTDVADTALRRMARDLRLALPNSIRVDNTGAFVEMLLTNAGGRYLAEEDNPTSGNVLDFYNSDNLTFDALTPAPVIAQGNSIVVYNLGPGLAPADAYCASTTGCNNRAVVRSASISNGVTTVTLYANPFPDQTPMPMRSPNRRFQVVTTPVTYGCTGNSLVRYSYYPISSSQSTPPLGAQTTAVLANGVTSCNFAYANLANVRSGLVTIGITLTGASEAGSVTLLQQVHVDNMP